jgi:integrase/recombinase XerD
VTGAAVPPAAEAGPTLAAMLPVYTEAMRMRNYAAPTIETQHMLMRWFARYAGERGVTHLGAVTRALCERYQRHLWTLQVRIGGGIKAGQPGVGTLKPLSITGQHGRLWAVVRFFRWCVRAGHLEHSPAACIELPRLPKKLPKPALTVAEVERVLAVPDIATAIGLRDRTMLEVFYATGIRRSELTALAIDDLDREREVVRVRCGKGQKGRIVPISARALAWVDHYLREVWAHLPAAAEHRRLFVIVGSRRGRENGRPLAAPIVTRQLGSYLVASGVAKPGACHIYRHTAATLMMENGADIRAIQDFLGHTEIKTTGIYTNVSFKFLKEQHRKCHPSAMAADAAALPPVMPADGAVGGDRSPGSA